MTKLNDFLFNLLKPERLTAVVDVGANPIDGDPPYKELLAQGLCRVVGFEPQPEALAELNSRKSEFETYLPYVIGDGAIATLKVCRAPGMTSLLNPDLEKLKYFRGFETWAEVISEVQVQTRRLDEIDEIKNLDLLKIDVQGSELSVFEHAAGWLDRAVVVQTEVSFIQLYKQQPTVGDVDLKLRECGFTPHCFAAVKQWMISPMLGANVSSALNQLLEADLVYVRDFTRPNLMSSEQLKHLAIIAHHCYRSFDLAANCIFRLAERGLIPRESVSQYVARGLRV